MNTEFAFTEQGDLRIALTAQGRQFIQERLSLVTQISQRTETELFLELMDDQLVQGWYVVPTQHVQHRRPVCPPDSPDMVRRTGQGDLCRASLLVSPF